MIAPPYMAAIRRHFSDSPHGTRHRYLGGCRCVPCRASNSSYERQCAARRRAGEGNPWVSARTSQQWIIRLQRLGLGRRAIAAAADIPPSTVVALRNGSRLHLRAQTERRLLAIQAPDAMADHALVDAGPTRRILRELLDGGYTKRWIARQLGSRAKTPSLQLDAQRLTAIKASKVERLYRLIQQGKISR